MAMTRRLFLLGVSSMALTASLAAKALPAPETIVALPVAVPPNDAGLYAWNLFAEAGEARFGNQTP